MKIGDIVIFRPLNSEAEVRGKIVWKNTANVSGKLKTIFEVQDEQNDLRLISKQQICTK